MINALKKACGHILAPLVAVLMTTSCATETRYDDISYLKDWNQPPLHLKVLYRTPLTSTRDPHSVMAYLTEGQTVEVVGLGESQDYVNARIATGPAQGWVNADALEFPPTELVTRLHDRRAKAEAHRDLIEHHEVVVGMTFAEVRASLGKPDRLSRVRAKQGDEEQWRYITYKHVPRYVQHYDANGQSREVVSYQRAQSGQRVIKFRNDEVVEIAEEPTDQSSPPAMPPRPVVP